MFCGCSFLSSLGLGLSTERPPSHFPGSPLSFEDAGRPSPALLQTQLTEACSRAAPQGPQILSSVSKCRRETLGVFFGGGVVYFRKISAIYPIALDAADVCPSSVV